MHFQCLQHVPHEVPGIIASWMRRHGHSLELVRLYAGELPAAPEAMDGVLSLGGPMSVHDEATYPWLHAEKDFLRSMVTADKYVLGICLGAQMIASVLGAAVTHNKIDGRHEKEIGWYPVFPTNPAKRNRLFASFPEVLTVFHWHGDSFTLPHGATCTLQNGNCAHQGFIYGARIIGLQCHLEMRPEDVESLLRKGAEELRENAAYRFVQPAERILEGAQYYLPMHHAMYALLEAWLDEGEDDA